MTPDLIAYDLIKRGKITESLEYLDEAIEKGIGDLLKLHEDRAYVYLCMGDNVSAMNDFSKALQIEPKSNYSLFNRAMINFSAGKLNDAVTDFGLISEINLLDDKYWILGKDLYTKTRNYERALYFIERLCQFDTENHNYVYNKAWCLSKLQRYKESILHYQSLIGKVHYDYILFNNLGFVYTMSEEYDVARSFLLKGLELEPEYAYLNSNISIVYYFHKQLDKAFYHIEKSIEIAPSNSLAYFLRSKYLLSQGRHEEAARDMEMAEKLGIDLEFSIERKNLERILFRDK